MSNHRIKEKFLPILWQKWRDSNAIQSMSMSERGVFLELLIEQHIYGRIPSDLHILSKRTAIDLQTLRRWFANNPHMFRTCDADAAYMQSKSHNFSFMAQNLEEKESVNQTKPNQTRQEETKPEPVGGQDGLPSAPDVPVKESKKVLGFPAEVNQFCKDFHLLLYPKKDPKSYPAEWLEEFSSLWDEKKAETTLDELLVIARWGVSESPVQENFSWTEQIKDMKSFVKFIRKGTLTASWSASRRKTERQAEKGGTAEARLKAKGEKVW